MGCGSSASATVKKYKVKVAAEDEKEVLKDELAKKEEELLNLARERSNDQVQYQKAINDLRQQSALQTIKYYLKSSSWTDTFADFVDENCKCFRLFDPKTVYSILEVHKMMKVHKEFKKMVDDAITAKLLEVMPEMDLKDFAFILTDEHLEVEKKKEERCDVSSNLEVRRELLKYDEFLDFGHFMLAQYKRLQQVTIQVFHDGENCYLGNAASLDPSALIHEAIKEIELVAGLQGPLPWHWRLYLPNNEPDRVQQHPSHKTVETLGNTGVEYHQVPCTRPGDVDTKLKDGLARFMRENRATAGRHFVVIVSGDSDFSLNLQELRFEGFRTMLFHGPPLKPGMAANADHVSNVWFKLVTQAGGGLVSVSERIKCFNCGGNHKAAQCPNGGGNHRAAQSRWRCTCGFSNNPQNRVCGGAGPLGCNSPKPVNY